MGLTKEQAVELYDTEWWKGASFEQIARFQLFEPLLCCPFGVFHEAIEKKLKRPVFSHEFGFPEAVEGMKKEINGEKDPPSIEEIINLIPEEKRIVILG